MSTCFFILLLASSAEPLGPRLDPRWEAELARITAAVWRDSPQLGAALRRLRGLDPQHYLARRRPEPEVGRELKPMAVAAWPLMIELLRQDTAAYPFAPPAAYPPALAGAARAELRARERAALRIGLIGALGNARAQLALPFLLELATDDRRDEPERRAAALAAGELARDLGAPLPAALLTIADDPFTSAWLRAGALVAVAKAGGAMPSTAFAALAERLHRAETASSRQAAVIALAVLASQLSETPDPNAFRSQIAELLAAELSEVGADLHEVALIEALAVVGSPAVTVLERRAADDRVDPNVRARVRRALAQIRLAAERRR